jgi:sugar phosphate isomerase/epimerase
MRFSLAFSSSSRVWEDITWVYGIEDAGYTGWEIVADGRYRLDNPETKMQITETLASTGLTATVHAPYGDLNLASLNYPIWRESVRQVVTCIGHGAAFTDRVTIHPGYLSPVGKILPGKAWDLQKEALVEIGRCAVDHGVTACLENMIGIKEFLCREPGELAGMTDGIAGIGMTIDFGHANTVGKVDAFLPCLRRASHVHIHDNHGSSDEHLALGQGTIPWERVGPVIARDYRGIVVVEGRSVEEGRLSRAMVERWFV